MYYGNNYNPWDVSNYGTSQYQYPPTIGNCVGFTNSQTGYYQQPVNNYYDPYGQPNYNYYGYNSYYNPYEYQRQREEQERAYREAQINRMKFYADLDRSFYAYRGIKYEVQDPEEKMRNIEAQYQYVQDVHAQMNQHSMFSLEGFHYIQWDPQPDPNYQPPEEEHVDVQEWFDNINYMLSEIMLNKAKEQSRNLQNAYNSDNYNRLLNSHNNTDSVMDALSRDFTIDDMEIKLPDKFSEEYNNRRKRFMEALFS